MTLPDTVKEYSEYAAREFLQTVVFIDDRIYAPQSGSVSEVKKVVPPKVRKKVSKNTSAQSKFTGAEGVQGAEGAEGAEGAKGVAGADVEAEEFSSHDIVMSFAKMQIICSLYQPDEDEKDFSESDILPLCRAADIVIVDWDLYGDSGQWALKLIGELIQQAVRGVPEQLRLILVYTQEQNLFHIADQLYQTVKQDIGDVLEPLQDEGGLAFHTANSRVSVLGKKGRERPDVSEDHVVYEKHLADIAIKEFSKLANGLLHAATLLCLAEIKKNSRKILSKFGAELDPAFLTHRAMCLPGEDATSHIVPLLISEIEAVLENVLPDPLASKPLLSNWCQEEWQPGDHLGEMLGNGDLDMRAIAEAICLLGFDGAKERFEQVPKLSNNSNTRKASKILLPAEDDKANHRFSCLMANRTFYHQKPKPLRLGSVLFRKRDKTYLLCVQPVCDSVRLEKDTSFIFAELTVTEQGEDKNPASHIVVREHNEFVELHYQPKSYRCFVAIFAPDRHTKQVLAKESAREKSPVFDDKSRRRYLWVDQLKISHAQRAVEDLARDLSRVGLTESEWLRRLNRK